MRQTYPYIVPLLLACFCLISSMAFAKEHNRWNAMAIYKDIAYGTDTLQKLDVYAPKTKAIALRPVHIFIHGGAWKIGDKKRYANNAKFYTGHGIIFIAINYRLAPKHMHPAQVTDSAAAIRWVYGNIERYGGDRDNIHLSGHSAGAHLAALVGTDEQYIRAQNLDFSILKTVISVDTASFDLNANLIVGERLVQRAITQTFGKSVEARANASPLTHAKKGRELPRFLLFVTTERPKAVTQTRNFHNALMASAAHSDSFEIEGLSHRNMAKAMIDPQSLVAKEILKAILE